MDERAIYKESKWDTFNKVSKNLQVTLINQWNMFNLKKLIISKTMQEINKVYTLFVSIIEMIKLITCVQNNDQLMP